MVKIEVNDKIFDLDVPLNTPLLWILREELALKGTKFGCGKGLCGACTVHINDKPMRSCITPIGAVLKKKIVTIDHYAHEKNNPVVRMWDQENVAQCGYCQAGQIMSCISLLKAHPEPNEDQITSFMNGNLCRCGTYPRIKKAISKLSHSKRPIDEK